MNRFRSHPGVPLALLAVFALAAPAQEASLTKRTEWNGLLEYVSAESLMLRLGDGRIVAFALPPLFKPAPAQIAAAHKIGERVTVESTVPAAGSAVLASDPAALYVDGALPDPNARPPQALPINIMPVVADLHFTGAPTAGELTAALRSPAGREAGNLLAHPPAAPAAAPPPTTPQFEVLRQGVLDYLAKLPNYLADEIADRMYPETFAGGRTVSRFDNIESALSWDGAHEAREHIERNGDAWNKPYAALPGIDWTGGFAGRLEAIFGRECPNAFTLDGARETGGRTLTAYRFQAPPEGCGSAIRFQYQSVYAGAEGTVYFEPATGILARLEEKLTGLPPGFPITALEDTIAWGGVTIDGVAFQLPVSANETVGIADNVYQVRTVYKNYRHFGVTTNITIHPRE